MDVLMSSWVHIFCICFLSLLFKSAFYMAFWVIVETILQDITALETSHYTQFCIIMR